jgi:uroporphyrinogen decarboxylase
MNSRERVRRSIYFSGPDHIPHYLCDGLENDIVWIWVPRPPAKQEWQLSGNQQCSIDEWGVTWRRARGSSAFGEAKAFPIEQISKHEKYDLPDLNNPAYIKQVAGQIWENQQSYNPKYVLGVLPFNSLNEGIHNIIGLENMFLAYHEEPEHLKQLIARFAAAQEESIRLLAANGCDGVMAYDDWGVQDRLLISREMIIEFFLTHYRRNWKIAHDLGMDVWMHSCGHISDILGDFIDAGLNVIQMDQQEHVGLESLNEQFGGKIAFWCPVDVQKTMVTGSPREVKEYVQRMIRTLGSHNGGFISMYYGSPEAVGHSAQNTAAMCEAFRLFGNDQRQSFLPFSDS